MLPTSSIRRCAGDVPHIDDNAMDKIRGQLYDAHMKMSGGSQSQEKGKPSALLPDLISWIDAARAGDSERLQKVLSSLKKNHGFDRVEVRNEASNKNALSDAITKTVSSEQRRGQRVFRFAGVPHELVLTSSSQRHAFYARQEPRMNGGGFGSIN